MDKSNNIIGVLLIAVSAVSFGLMPIFAKTAYAAGASTYTVLFLRFLTGAVFMFGLMLIRRLSMPTRKEINTFLLLGAIGYMGQSFCYFTALNYTTAGTVSLLLYTYPALVMAGSIIFLKEKVTLKKILALILALVGSFIIIGTDFKANMTGMLLALGSAVIYSVYILVSSRVIKVGMSIQSSAFIMLGAAVIYGVINIFTGLEPPTGVKGVVSVGLIALVSTVIALVAFFAGLGKTGPSTASLVSTLEPVVTVIFSAIVLSEMLTVNMVIGGCLIISALIVTILPSK